MLVSLPGSDEPGWILPRLRRCFSSDQKTNPIPAGNAFQRRYHSLRPLVVRLGHSPSLTMTFLNDYDEPASGDVVTDYE